MDKHKVEAWGEIASRINDKERKGAHCAPEGASAVYVKRCVDRRGQSAETCADRQDVRRAGAAWTNRPGIATDDERVLRGIAMLRGGADRQIDPGDVSLSRDCMYPSGRRPFSPKAGRGNKARLCVSERQAAQTATRVCTYASKAVRRCPLPRLLSSRMLCVCV